MSTTHHFTRSRSLAVAAALALTLGACASDDGDTNDSPSAAEQTTAAEQATEESVLLEQYDIQGGDAVEVIDYMDRLGGDDRPAQLLASVRADHLLLAEGDTEETLPIPEDRFYISIAPYVDSTHDCYYHSLTTCQGELVEEELDIEVRDETNGEVLLDETVTTFENGFYGFWVPRDIEGTITIEHGGRTGELEFTTDEEAATCLTTMQLT